MATEAAAAPTTNGRVMVDGVPASKSLLVRNIPADFDQARCEEEFRQFPGFVGFKMITRGKGSGFLTYDSIEHAMAAKKEFNNMSILKVTFRGSTCCDYCDAVVMQWISSPCRAYTFCRPRCMVDFIKAGNEFGVETPTECHCGDKKFAGMIRCGNFHWCRVSCMEASLEENEKIAVPVRIVIRRRFNNRGGGRRERETNSTLRGKMGAMRKDMKTLTKSHEDEIKSLKEEIKKLQIAQGITPAEEEKVKVSPEIAANGTTNGAK